ncbi:acyltransferase family protein [Amycolatopsis jiangsuensis]|uniref:Fucose 4-O-acetylase-like acetyltransferase n=1 Tax=Amycolatopsis jiangsuensis TaxID=1181879 RepID=A0A840IXN0_9PSEU|nr:acyltransferase [Amycolatopsis jiangsuensis]MBB4685908.1 fucose 4-O-acetylase-like acetyltransferase [Amycolatopsis jiangsuensis]
MTMSLPRVGTSTAEPRRRDAFLDVVRAGAILAVVAQHWIMPVLSYSGGTLATGNALSTPGWWSLTWLSQVMPLVFFAGGAANLISLRRAESSRAWFAGRVRRLLVPVLPLMAVWLVVPDLLRGMGIPQQPVRVAGSIAAQLLWFLSVYLLTVLLTPLMVAAHRRWGLAVPVVLAVAGVVIDVARFSDVGLLGYANAVVVWLAVHQLGFHYVEGRLGTLGRRAALGLSAAGFATTALMVACGPYPASMIGMPGAPVSNMSPPTVLLFFLAIGQIGLLLAFRQRLARLPAGTALGWLGARFMSVYLWHMPALIVVSGITVYGLGYATPHPGSTMWWLMLPGWVALCGAVLLGLLRLFERFETQRDSMVVTAGTAQLVVAGLLASGGLLGLAANGFRPLSEGLTHGPLPWVVLTAAGFALAGRQVRLPAAVALTR